MLVIIYVSPGQMKSFLTTIHCSKTEVWFWLSKNPPSSSKRPMDCRNDIFVEISPSPACQMSLTNTIYFSYLRTWHDFDICGLLLG